MRSLFLLVGIMVLVIGVFAFIAAPGIGAAPETPPPDITCHIAIVDGDESEWDLAADFVAEMYQGGQIGNLVTSKFYMRNDPETETVYILVLLESGHVLDPTQLDKHWVEVATPPASSSFIRMVDGEDGDDGTPPDFAFIYDGEDAVGWEASFILPEGTNYNIDVQTKLDDGEISRVNLGGFEFSVNCLGIIGDQVWYDEDGNGNPDEDFSTHGLNGITVRLLKQDETDKTIFTNVDTVKTGPPGGFPDGYYGFVDVPAGNYMVDVHDPDISETEPFKTNGWVSTTNNDPYPRQDNPNKTETIDLAQGETYLNADFGYNILDGVVALGDWVWYDEDDGGDQNEGPEYGIPCVTVTMFDENDGYLGQTNTDSWGYYYYGGMDPSPEFKTVVNVDDEDIDNFISWFNGEGEKTCNLVKEDWPENGSAGALMTPMEFHPTTGTSDTTNILDKAGEFDYSLDFAFNVGPLAISLTSFEVAEAAAAPGNWALVAGLMALLGTGAWLLRRRKQEVK